MEYATFFIIPDWMRPVMREKILSRIRSVSGLEIELTKKLILEQSVLEVLYERHVSTVGHEIYWEAVMKDMLGKEVTVGVVSGKHAMWDIVAITGAKTIPQKCSKGSIRSDFGQKVRPVECGDLRYWKNVIHRSKRPDEVKRDMKLFFPEREVT